ncbi:MAG: hypothetical protein U0929_01670 [Planctomycetaceae bacterium]
MTILRSYGDHSAADNRYAIWAFQFLNPETRDEAVQEEVAKSFAAYRRILYLGREHAIAAFPLDRFEITQAEVGRCIGNQLNTDDASSRYFYQRQSTSICLPVGHSGFRELLNP